MFPVCASPGSIVHLQPSMVQDKSNINLKVGISNRHILKIALPIAFAILIPQLNFITNNIFLGRLGEQQLAVAGITGVYYLVFATIGFGLNNGLQALISRRAGQDRAHEIGNIFNQGVRISLFFAAFSILVTYFLAPPLLSMSLHNPSDVAIAVQFLRLRIWGLPFLYIYQMRNALLVGTNQSKLLVSGTLAETIANIVLDYGFIFGHFGLPALGFDGAAYASILSEITGLVVVFFVMQRRGVGKQLQLFKKYPYDADKTKLILIQSFPTILQYVLSLGSWEFFYILVEHHGVRSLAISNTMRNIFGLFGCLTWAFASTTTSMVSNIIGQGLQSRVPELLMKIIKLSTGLSLIVFVLLNTMAGFYLQVYGQGEAFINEAMPVVRVVSSALIIMSFSAVYLNAVLGTGNSKINLAIEIFAIIIYSLYAYYTLEYFNLPIYIGWMAEWFYWLFIFFCALFYMRSGRWKNKVI